MMNFTSRTYLLPEGLNILMVLYLTPPFIKIIIVITVILVSIFKLSLDLVAMYNNTGPSCSKPN